MLQAQLAAAAAPAAPLALWAAVVAPTEPSPLVSPADLNRALAALQSAGAPSSPATPILHAAHGPAQGAAVQSIVLSSASTSPSLLLLGGFIQRQHRTAAASARVLTLVAELDGLVSPLRMAEALHFAAAHASTQPFASLPQQSHAQFVLAAGPPSAQLPSALLSRDLCPETSQAAATNATVAALVPAVRLWATPNASSAAAAAAAQALATQTAAAASALAAPLAALQLEGSAWLSPPCYKQPGANAHSPRRPSGTDCTFGSPWMAQAQSVLGIGPPAQTPTNFSIATLDHFWPVNRVFPHDYLPKINNTCRPLSPGCQLQALTVTEPSYVEDSADDGSAPVAADELKAKLSTRQRCLEHAGFAAPDFNVTDEVSVCAEVNAAALAWAVTAASSTATARYAARGQRLVFGTDKNILIYPEWDAQKLAFAAVPAANGSTAMQVTSPTVRYSTSSPIPLIGGLHFCKLLSPARALDWVLVQSLRAADGASSPECKWTDADPSSSLWS